MPHGAHVISLLEDALAESFQFHGALDTFLLHSGISNDRLVAARGRAEDRAKASPRKFARAPKRIVVQELLRDLNHGTNEEDRLVAGLLTALRKGTFRDATPLARAAIEKLMAHSQAEHDEAEARREEQRQKARDEERVRERAAAEKAARRERFREEFVQLSQHTDPQARGYMLEKFLNELFSFEGLNPRGSFKLLGEQIDGSFAWSGRVYLVEARWVSAPVGGTGFSGLMYKIEGKTADTRGLFVSINGYSRGAIEGLRQKGELRFVCIDGAHIMRSLEPSGSFVGLLDVVWRHASETGEAYLPVSAMRLGSRSRDSGTARAH